MKINRILFCAAALLALATACNKAQQEEIPEGMTLTPDSLVFAAQPASSQTVEVVSSKSWKVTECPEWVMLTKDGTSILDQVIPEGKVSINVSLTPNNSFDRDTVIVFNGGTLAKKALKISQAGNVTYTSLADVKAQLGASSSVTLPAGTVVKVTVISNGALNNQTSTKNAMVQDTTAGICIRFSADHSYQFGDEITINLEGQGLSKFSGAYQLAVANANVLKVQSGSAPEALPVQEADFLDGKYEGMYVALADVEVAETDTAKTWVSGTSNTSINFVTKKDGAFVVFSGKNSTFGSQKVAAGAGTIKGIATVYNTTKQLMFAQTSDWAGLTGERFKKEVKAISVDEVLASASGKTVKTVGRIIKKINSGFILNDGTQSNLYVYDSKKLSASFAEKDIVEVVGSLTAYGTVVELVPTTVTASTASVAATPELTVNKLTAAQVASYAGKSAALVEIEGQFNYDSTGPFYNVVLDGQTIQGSLKIAADSIGTAIQPLNGKRVSAKGFFIGNTTKYFNVAITSSADVKASVTPFFTVSPTEFNVSASDTSVTFNISSNQDWTVASQTTGFKVSAASGTGNGQVSVSFPANSSTTDAKTGEVMVSCTGFSSVTVKINQSKKIDAGSMCFRKVTAAPADWSGEYLIVYEKDKDSVYVFNNKDAAFGYVASAVSGSDIAYSEDLAQNKVTVATMTGGYSIKLTTGKYISGTNNSNKLNMGDSAVLNTLSYTDASVKIESNTSVLRFNSAKSDMRFRYYKSSSYTAQKTIQLYKLVSK